MDNPDRTNLKSKKNKPQKKPVPSGKSKGGTKNGTSVDKEVISDSNEFVDLHKLISMGIVFQNAQGIITQANPSAERILSLPLDKMLGKTFSNFPEKFIREDGSDFPDDLYPAIVALQTGKPVNEVTMGIYNPQRERYNWILVSAVPEFSPGQNKAIQVVSTFTDITNLKNIIDTFGKYETFLNLAMVASDLGIWKLNFQSQQFFFDETTRRHFGFATDQINTVDILDRIHPEDSKRVTDEAKEFLEQGSTDPAKTEFRIVLNDGTIKWLVINVITQFDQTASGMIPVTVVGTSLDITERKQAEEALKRKTRALFLQSNSNQALVKISNEMDLLQEICRICVEDGGYRMAWVGYVDNGPNKRIQPVAQFGLEDDYLKSINITWADTEQGRGPTGTAVRTNQPTIIQNIQRDSRTLHWREAASKRGYASTIALPLNIGWNIIGVFTLYAKEENAFKPDEVALLIELTKNLTFGIEALRTRANQDYLERELRKSEGRYKLAQKSALIGSWEWDLRENTLFWSDEMYVLFDKKPANFIPTYADMTNCIVPEDRFRNAQAINGSTNTGKPFDVEFRILDSTGRNKWINSKGNTFCEVPGQPVLAAGTMQDITQRKQMEEALLQANRNYRLISENTNDVIWVLDVKTLKFKYVSPSVKKLRGYSIEEMMQQSLKDTLTPESFERAKYFFEQSIPDSQQGKPITTYPFELDQLRKDGSIIATEVTSTQVYDDQGNLEVVGISRDISERKRVEEALHEERNLFQVLMNNIPDAIYFKNRNSRFIRINQAEAEYFSFNDPSEAVGKTDFDIFAEEHARPAYENEQEIIRTGKPLIDFEEKETYPDGRERWISTSKMPFRNSSGEILGTFGISHDVTKRKEMELSLQQRVMELETVYQLSTRIREVETVQELIEILLKDTLKILNSQDGGIFLFEPSNNKLMLCAAYGWFEQLTGLSLDPDEGINGHVFTTNQPYITYEMQSDLLLAQKVKDLIPIDQYGGFFPIQCSEGTIGVIDVYVTSPRVFSENEQRLLAIISEMAGNSILRSRLNEKLKHSNMNLQEEIDQRIAYQAMLAAEKELLSTTLMSIGEGVIITNKEGLIILFNRSAESITGYEANEILEKPLYNIFQVIDPNTKKIIPDLIQNLYQMGQVQEHEPNYKAPLLISKSGERILIDGSISPLKSPEGEMMGHVLVFQDVTEKQKAEAQTALSQKMEAIGLLAAGIAHEINTPIQYVGDNLRFLQKTVTKFTEVLNAYEMLLSKPDQSINQEDLDHLDEVNKQTRVQHYLTESPNAVQEALDGVERVRKIVLAMREFSHPSEKEKKLADINHGIETTIVISRNEWKYFAELETDLDPNLPLVNCQIDEINQVILNMIINAVQAIQEKFPADSEQKGKIIISTRTGENKVIIKIEDTGKGMPEAIQQRIFDPFFTTKGIGKGTGQGLSLAHQIIVQKHQGTINVFSILGEGTTFTIELPIGS
jgi:PAS domain S-box-containing protein